MSRPLLSVLICALEQRHDLLLRLLKQLEPQCQRNNIELLIETDDGKITTGHKRNLLLQRSTADYVCFVDEDDEVSERYGEGLLLALVSRPDCVGIQGVCRFTDGGTKRLEVSRLHTIMCRKRRMMPTHYILRATGHLTPVRRDIAIRVGFPDMTCGEDSAYSHRLRDLLVKETPADPALTQYIYNVNPAVSTTWPQRQGVAYWNAFGGDFDLTMAVDFGTTAWPILNVGDQEISVASLTGRRNVSLRLVRKGVTVEVSVAGSRQSVPVPSGLMRFALMRPAAAVVSPTHGSVTFGQETFPLSLDRSRFRR